ncbi:MAG: hypothetical protein OXI56_05040 [bacterium]|nr:hypothetical protein [bacterium]MDE0601143.1 hypothetical protein [bacterium]
MSDQALREIIDRAVADYGFRLAVMWGTDDVIAGSDLTTGEAEFLRDLVVPELKKLPNPVEPVDHAAVQERLANLAS